MHATKHPVPEAKHPIKCDPQYHLARNYTACHENMAVRMLCTWYIGGTVCGMSGFCLNEDSIAAKSLVCIQYK